jgi:hypothetical protein
MWWNQIDFVVAILAECLVKTFGSLLDCAEVSHFPFATSMAAMFKMGSSASLSKLLKAMGGSRGQRSPFSRIDHGEKW